MSRDTWDAALCYGVAVLTPAVLCAAVVMLAPRASAAPVCHEDQACWQCDTMGNGICARDAYVRVQRLADGHWRLVKRTGGVRWIAPLPERIAAQGPALARATETTLYAWRTR